MGDPQSGTGPEPGMREMEIQNQAPRLKLTKEKGTSDDLRGQLLWNQKFGKQINPTMEKELVSYLKKNRPEVENVLPEFRNPNTTAITLADDFPDVPHRPAVPYSVEYLYAVARDLSAIGSDHTPPEGRFVVMEDHLAWLSARISDIVKGNVAEDISILVAIMRQVIVACNPSGLGRVALYMIIANISQRSSMIRDETLWWDLHDATLDGQQGSLDKEWDVLHLVALAWFMVVGEHGSSLMLNLKSDHPQVHKLTQSLRGVHIYDFVGLLSQPSVKDFLEEGKACVLSLTNGSQKMIILRLGRRKCEEYIWVRAKGLVTSYQAGLTFRLCVDETPHKWVLYTKPMGSQIWFKAEDGALLEYCESYHMDEFEAVSAKYGSGELS